MQFSIKELAENTDGVILKDNTNPSFKFNISTDTRKILKNDFYLPLRGETYDGHCFIDNAVKAGATGYFTQDKSRINNDAKAVIYVQNTLLSYLKLANCIRKTINPKVIAVTGSSGKTTVKEMLYSVFQTTYKTHKTLLNHNNEIGLCETFFQTSPDSDCVIVEMGMRNLGEIELLSLYAEPDIGIITNTGCAHVELLGNIKNITAAKCEIASHLNKNGVFIAPDSKNIKETVKFEGEKIFTSLKNCKNILIKKGKSIFEYENEKFELSIEGEHNVSNALLVIEAAKKAGISIENIKKGLIEFKPVEKRWETLKTKNFNFINDSYNANPDSMKAAIKTFLAVNNPPLALVLGDMGELGKDSIAYHKEIGGFLSSLCENKPDITVLTVGELAKFILKASSFEGKSFDTTTECAHYIVQNLKPETTILLKASRFMKFEEIIETVKSL